MAKYHALQEFLQKQSNPLVRMSFEQIERIIGEKLPRSAMKYRAWWSNNERNSVMTKAWKDAGFISEQVDMDARKLVFRRADRLQSSEGTSDRESRASGRHPLIGWMKGTVTIPEGVDLTQPADAEWGNVTPGMTRSDDRR